MLSSGDSFPHLIQKRRSQLGFLTYLLNYPRIMSFVLLYEVQESVMHDGQFMWKLLFTLTLASTRRHLYSLAVLYCFVPCAELCVREAQIFSYADVAVIHVCAHSTHTHTNSNNYEALHCAVFSIFLPFVLSPKTMLHLRFSQQ